MNRWPGVLVALATVGWSACSSRPAGDERAAVESAPVMPTAAQGRVAPPLPPTQAGSEPVACGLEPPPILGPADGSVVSGHVNISSPLVEGPCVITATIVFMVADASGNLVRTGCANDLPAHIAWDTTHMPNGQYWITAQRACGCAPCAEFSYVGVTVSN